MKQLGIQVHEFRLVEAGWRARQLVEIEAFHQLGVIRAGVDVVRGAEQCRVAHHRHGLEPAFAHRSDGE